jgi:hypothetical protein
MKKIALSLVALSALSLAACGGNTNRAANNTLNTQDAMNQANSDIENAAAASQNALDTQMNAVANATDAAQGAVANASAAANNAVQNAAR